MCKLPTFPFFFSLHRKNMSGFQDRMQASLDHSIVFLFYVPLCEFHCCSRGRSVCRRKGYHKKNRAFSAFHTNKRSHFFCNRWCDWVKSSLSWCHFRNRGALLNSTHCFHNNVILDYIL